MWAVLIVGAGGLALRRFKLPQSGALFLIGSTGMFKQTSSQTAGDESMS